ncbi:MAG: hypothetical protein QNJ97_29065 [Myxococcota bacterium]|nr:hypothetical protein [Myxococcota bacterium]
MRKRTIHRWTTLTLQLLLVLGLILAMLQARWLAALVTMAIMLVTMLPVALGKRFQVYIPPEFEALAVVFIFASLFLGEVGGFYTRFWWWDVVLHTSSGFLLGILGFLLVHVLNEKEDIDLHMKPRFVALFAFMFAMGLGAVWEIFEFAMDSIFGMNMQKSGLTDTMWDLIVDAIGALAISVLGLFYISNRGNESFLESWIKQFFEHNPRLFRASD